MAHRFYIDTPIEAEQVTLGGTEAQHHLLHVMRLSAGDEITLFDGSGMEFVARIEKTQRSDVELVVLSREAVDRELPFELTVGVALPKGDRQRWFVEKAVELGITRIVPLVTERSVAQPVAKALVRLRRSVVEASKQCGRNRLLEVTEPQALGEYLAGAPEGALRLLAHPGSKTSAEGQPNQFQREATTAALLAIGPEGGFSDAEVQQARTAAWQTVDLGPRILRIETAAILLTAKLLATEVV